MLMCGYGDVCKVIKLLFLFFFVSFSISTTVRAQDSIVTKSCGNCFKVVSINSRVGDECPHCGAYWGSASSFYYTEASRRSLTNQNRDKSIPFSYSFSIADYSSSYIDGLAKSNNQIVSEPKPSLGFEMDAGLHGNYNWVYTFRLRYFNNEFKNQSYEWKQVFIEMGGKYSGFIHLTDRFVPFIGVGLGFTGIDNSQQSQETQEIPGQIGIGYYFELGIEYRITKVISFLGATEYCSYNLSDDDENGVVNLGNDNRLFFKLALAFSFRRSLSK